MLNTPSSNPVSVPRKGPNRAARTSRNVQVIVAGLSAATFGLLVARNDQAAPSRALPVPAKAPDLDVPDAPVSALYPLNASNNVVLPRINLPAKPKNESVIPPEKTPARPMTIDELPDGEIPHGTEIQLIDENGEIFVLSTAETGDVLMIDGERFEQVAIASKKTLFGSLPLGEHQITWRAVERVTRDGIPMFAIHGGRKGEQPAETDEVSIRSQQDLATLCRNAKANGQFEFALPNKTVTGVGEVMLVGKIQKAEEK